jgi:tetratricopeptide (TPR) repeat protein
MTSLPEALQVGLEHHRAGRLIEAEDVYLRILKVDPRHARASHLLGLIAFQVGRLDEAVQYLNEAIQADRFHAPYHTDLGEIYRSLGRIPEAIESYRSALKLHPEMVEAQNNLGTLLQASGNLTEAVECFEDALESDPNHAEVWRNLGTALRSQEQLAEAHEAYQRSLRLAPDAAETYFQLGMCFAEQGEPLDAIACYQKASQLNPDWPEPHMHCALVRLGQGDFARGWREFEWRLRSPQYAVRYAELPVWSGANFEGRRLLVYAEGGLSDTLQFMRYLPLVEARGLATVFEVHQEWVPLLEQSCCKQLVPFGTQLPPCDVQMPLWSLPRVFGTTLASIPAQVPYLRPNAEFSAQWREKLAPYRGLKVGIQGQGGRFHKIPLRTFEPLTRVANVTLFSLQVGEGREDLATPGGKFSAVDLGVQFDSARGIAVDAAAAIANLDLVIAADSPTAHLAGALGVPVWVGLSTASDWRWLREREDSPWYPTMRLFRQTTLGNWSEVIERMAIELAHLATTRI